MMSLEKRIDFIFAGFVRSRFFRVHFIPKKSLIYNNKAQLFCGRFSWVFSLLPKFFYLKKKRKSIKLNFEGKLKDLRSFKQLYNTTVIT